MNLALWTAVGVGLGAVLAQAFDNAGAGVAIGIAAGVVLGGIVAAWRRTRT